MGAVAGGPSVLLNDGFSIPQIGFGVFQIPEDGAQRAVEEAFEAGYRHIDTAAAYNNEAGVGAAIAASGLPRAEIFITTKLRNGEQGRESTLRAFDASRAALGIETIDLYLIHWPSPARDLYVESWKTFEELKGGGGVRSIGVSNFLESHLDRLLAETDIVPAVNQIEIHPTFQQPDVVEHGRARGIAHEAYSPLGQGSDLDSDVVTGIASRLGVTPAQVVLRWHLQNGTILIPKSANRDRMRSNIDILEFALTDEDVASITQLETGHRIGGDPVTAEWSQIR
jgi:2,5-diketo-D-gluconate reductase A